MLTSEQRAALLAAVPSFAPRWTAWQRDQLDYTSRFPEEKLTDDEVEYDFLWELGEHIATRFTIAKDERELVALCAALEDIYAEADAELYSRLTLHLLEHLISSLEREGQDAATMQNYMDGPLTKRAWGAAWDWMHP